MKICEYSYTAHVEVRYAETDQMGIVHHSVYAIWFEQARTEFFRTAGANFAEMEAEGFASPVLELNVKFKRPTHYGEIVDIETTMIKEDLLRVRFCYNVYVKGKLCATGYTLHCFTKGGKPTRDVPKNFSKFIFVDK